MEKNDVNHPRLIRQLRWMIEDFAKEAHCYGYRDDPDYLKIKAFLEQELAKLQEE